jgi:hypothetical protein
MRTAYRCCTCLLLLSTAAAWEVIVLECGATGGTSAVTCYSQSPDHACVASVCDPHPGLEQWHAILISRGIRQQTTMVLKRANCEGHGMPPASLCIVVSSLQGGGWYWECGDVGLVGCM